MRRVKITSADFAESNLKNIDWKEMEVREVQIYKGYTSTVNSVSFSSSGDYLASGSKEDNNKLGSGDNIIRIWDLKSGNEKLELKGHTS